MDWINLFGLLYQPLMMDYDECRQSVEWLERDTEVLGGSLPQCRFGPPQIPHVLTWAPTQAAAMGSRRLTAWATARPVYSFVLEQGPVKASCK
jgi:hypothetical protein